MSLIRPSSQGDDQSRAAGTRHELLGVLALGILAALLRAFRWGQTEVLFNDGPVFVDVARSIARGDFQAALAHPFHPLYPACVALVSRITGDLETAAVAVSILGGSAAVLALYVFLRSAFGITAALVGAALLAVHPLAIEFSGDVQSEGLYMALFVGAVALLWHALCDGRARLALAAGIVVGLAYLTRPEGLGVAVVGIVLASERVVARRWSVAPALRFGAALTLGTALVAAPYVVTLHESTGLWLLSQKKTVRLLAGIEEQGGGRYQPPPTTRPVPRQALPADPQATAPLKGERSRRAARLQTGSQAVGMASQPTWLQQAPGAFVELFRTAGSTARAELALLLLVGLLASRGRPGLRGRFLLAITLLYGAVLLALTMNVGYVSRRHILPTLVPLLGYAALGAVWLGRMLVAGLGRARATAWVTPRHATAAVLVVMAVLGVAKALRPDRVKDLAERRAAEWLRAQNLEPGPVAARRLRVAYYADAPYVELPERPRNWIVLELRRYGARYVIVDEEKMEFYPGLREAVPRGLRPLHQVRAGGRVASVFEVVPGGREKRRGAMAVGPEGG